MVIVREATAADTAIVYDLIIGIAKHHNQEQYVATSREELLQSGFGQNPKFGVLLAEVEGEIAGYVSYTWNYSIWAGASYMNIDDVFIREGFRGQKIGKNLMFAAKGVCQNHDVEKIRWEVQQDNLRAISFYEDLGAKMQTKGVFGWDLSKQQN